MGPNTHSDWPAGQPADRLPDRLAEQPAEGLSDGLVALAEVVDGLAAQDLDGLTDAGRAERVLELRRLLDRLDGHRLKELAGVDARGAAGTEDGVQAAATARLGAPPPAHGPRGGHGRGPHRPGLVPPPPRHPTAA